jgi:hypothetical protein
LREEIEEKGFKNTLLILSAKFKKQLKIMSFSHVLLGLDHHFYSTQNISLPEKD